MEDIVHIDGSHGEGGGQILRTSLSLAAITGRSVEFENIRAGRSKPGLKAQHLAAVRAAAKICGAGMSGAEVGSQRLGFYPGTPTRPGKYRFDIGTAGASTLVMQTVLIPLALAGAPSEVVVTGGTHVPFAPVYEYLAHVYRETLSDHGVVATFTSPAAGFFPRGGGEIHARIAPSVLQAPIDRVERGALTGVTAYIVTANLSAAVANRGETAVIEGLRGVAQPTVIMRAAPSPGPGASIILIAHSENALAGFSAIGERGMPMETLAANACADLRAWLASGAACDEYLADQLVLPASLIPETSRWSVSSVTDHLRTVLHIVGQFVDVETSLEEKSDGTGVVTMRGAKR
ncbi:MAG: RNA 3'-terminal phosphate cyclase [Capsulimonas sp.]|uniref:RNA 3'-terminal phosphate cyclase n=1 Tax=Capsulimonas sp. TaxID=2494211 RepID=UPI003266C4CC